jgi:hypothetical protein
MRPRLWSIATAVLLGVAVTASTGIALAGSAPPSCPPPPTFGGNQSTCLHYQTFAVHTATPVTQNDFVTNYVPQAMSGYGGLFTVKTGNTSDGLVHLVWLGDRAFHTFRQWSLPLSPAAFSAYNHVATADFNGDGILDLYLFKRKLPEDTFLAFDVLDGAHLFGSFLAQVTTGIRVADWSTVYELGDYNRDGRPDLFTFKDFGTASGHLELAAWDAASGFRNPFVNAVTPVTAQDFVENFTFEIGMGDYSRDHAPDVYLFKVRNTGTGRLEVHILDGGSLYLDFALQTGTPITQADASGNGFHFTVADYTGDGVPDLYAVKPGNTGSGQLEVHVLDGNKPI